MLTKMRNRVAQEEGFTLIELLVVVLIIGILAAVAIPTFLSQKNKAYASNAKSDVKNAQTIVESYANGNGGNYPDTAATLNTAVPDSDSASLTSVQFIPATDDTSSGTQTDDSYLVYEQGQDGNYYYIEVIGGDAFYGVSSTTLSGATAPTASTTTPPAQLGTAATVNGTTSAVQTGGWNV